MARIDRRSNRGAAAIVAIGLVLSACDPTPSFSPRPAASEAPAPPATIVPTASPAARTGGTIYLLSQSEQWDQVDPQRVYTAEDIAFFGATIYRSLEAFVPSPDAVAGTTLTPDLATDLGRPSDGGRTWAFTLRNGVTFQTGDAITCEDIRYGVSRSFATDVINQGPTYAIQDLDIPSATAFDTSHGFLSHYEGPYVSSPGRQALFDKAVECSPDHRTIIFHLNRPIADFNATTTLGFSPVPRAADTGETFGTTPDSLPVSSGPYMVERYTPGQHGRFSLVRNPSWNPASDPIRKAYPDRWEVEFGIDPKEIDARIVASQGDDAFALPYGTMTPETQADVFAADGSVNPAFEGRAVEAFDPYARYDWINVTRVSNLKVRQAMLVALDRKAIRDVFGGASYAAFADGVIKPNLGLDYAPTGIWDSSFGTAIPESGDPVLARKLLEQSGVTSPTLTFRTPPTPTNEKVFKIVVDSLGRAGIKVERAEECYGYCSVVFDDKADFGTGGWGSDWPSASTVIPPLFTMKGGWDLSKVDDAGFSAAIADAMQTLDPGERAAKWQALSREAVENAWVIPTFFSLQHRIGGAGLGPLYIWPAYSSWPYGEMRVTP
jgi:peptide/nickel transport system substrate-binding protein